MDKNAIWKWLILIVLTAASLVVVTPPKDKIRLGLDLSGGTSFTVKIDKDQLVSDLKKKAITPEEIKAEVEKTLKDAQARTLEVLRNRIDGLGINDPVIYPGKDNRIIIQLPGFGQEESKAAEDSIKSVAFLEFRMVHKKNADLVKSLFEKKLMPKGYRIVRVDGKFFYKRDMDIPNSAMNREFRDNLGRFNVPGIRYEFMLEKEDMEGQTVYRPYFVKRKRELSGNYLESADLDYRALGQPVVKIEFDSRGTTKFANITSDYAPGGAKNPDSNTFRQLAIVLDGTLYSAPVINEAIIGGRAEISGKFSIQEALFLRNILNSGSLPAPLKIEEKRFIAPTLGQDSIDSGMRAIIYGGIAVLLFMFVYYLLAGVIANIALLLNMILLPLGMIVATGFLGIFAKSSTGGGAIQLPVLTLPGIAGILLTIGMAVDANVLIFERIREESVAGKRFWTTISTGYDRAFVTIMDANVTTLLTGIILFIFGSGPIRGFAVTLCAGILVSMFTAIVVTKLFFGIIASKTKIKTLKMLKIVGNTSIDFIGKRKIAAAISIFMIIFSVGLMIIKGHDNPNSIFGVDFTGGSSLTFTFSSKQSVSAIRNALEVAGINDANIQYQRKFDQAKDTFLHIKVGSKPINEIMPVEIVKDSLEKTFPDSGFVVTKEDNIGAQIGSELKRSAVWSIIIALIGIIIYLSWRFEFGFAIGAIVALAHDVFMTIGIYSLCDKKISLPIIAALLTIVGYSVNDTIVIFDRIREDVKLVRNKSFKDICNLSINQTLSRTILTSVTTLIAIVMLLVFGGGAINDFALALCIGVITGTYSSVFIATPVVMLWHRDEKPDLAKNKK